MAASQEEGREFPLETWIKDMQSLPASTTKNVLHILPTQVAVAVIVGYLHELPPERVVYVLHDLQEEIRRYFPEVYKSDGPVVSSPAAVPLKVSTGKTHLLVRVDDIIQLRAKDEYSQTQLDKCGSWWRIKAATKDKWFLASLPLKEQGLRPVPGFFFENRWLFKADDLYMEIIRVCPFPKVFVYKEYQ